MFSSCIRKINNLSHIQPTPTQTIDKNVDAFDAALAALYASGLPRDVERFIRDNKDDLRARIMNNPDIPNISFNIWQLACDKPCTTNALKRSMLISYIDGGLQDLVANCAPFDKVFDPKSARALKELVALGMFPCEGRESNALTQYGFTERASINASFASSSGAQVVCDALNQVEHVSWLMYSGSAWYLRLSGCDGDSFEMASANKNYDPTYHNGAEVLRNRTYYVYRPTQQTIDENPTTYYVDIGSLYIDIDPYKLNLSCKHIQPKCDVYSFVMWNDSWPMTGDSSTKRHSLEDRLLKAIKSSPMTLVM